MTSETCRHNKSAPQAMLLDLPGSQGGIGRHRCPICAYQLGINEYNDTFEEHGDIVKCKHGKFAPEKILKSLGESQGGSGRHKCVVCAYQVGRATVRDIDHEHAWSTKGNEQNGTITLIDLSDRTHEEEPDADWWKKDEERFKEIGDMGEKLALEYEKSILLSQGRHDLANKVTHVSKVEGDHVGYDIRSFALNGNVKFIEVKTTVNHVNTPFYMSENERIFSSANNDNYYIYRLFGLDEINEKADFYIVKGSVETNFSLKPTQYQVSQQNT